MREINVAMIGEGFMGRTHSNAWGQVTKFFKPPVRAGHAHRLRAPGGESQGLLQQLGLEPRLDRLGEHWSSSPEIDLVDIVTPNYMHAPVAMAAIEAGKHVACEKPIAGTLAEAREMAEAAKNAKVKTFVWFNYRRCPAVALAHKLVKDGAARRRSATSGRSTSKTGPTSRSRCLAVPERSWPAPAPTAT